MVSNTASIDQEFKHKAFLRPAVEANRREFVKAFKADGSLENAEAVVEKIARLVEKDAKALANVDTGAMRASIHVVDGDESGTSFEKLSHGQPIT